jgi:hypothetical protein
VAENAWIGKEGLVTFERVDIRATDTNPANPYHGFARARHAGRIRFCKLKSPRLIENNGFHVSEVKVRECEATVAYRRIVLDSTVLC